MPATYLITGGNRGIGKGLVRKLLARPQTAVIALVRKPEGATSQSLASLPKAEDSRLIVEKYDAASAESPFQAIRTIQSMYNIDILDVVIANSGINAQYGPAASVEASDLQSHYLVNAIGPVLLFQATLPLLQKSDSAKFFNMSTFAASITDIDQFPAQSVSYGMSKAAANYVIRKLHFDHESIVVQSLHPGWVDTDMGNFLAEKMGYVEGPLMTVEQSVDGLLMQMDAATKEGSSGKFIAWNGMELRW